MNSDELIEQLGDDWYEAKRLVSGGVCAYSTKELAMGKDLKEALKNLLDKVNARKSQG